jgi:hypothetical protein
MRALAPRRKIDIVASTGITIATNVRQAGSDNDGSDDKDGDDGSGSVRCIV